jgi:hypothetical protein
MEQMRWPKSSALSRGNMRLPWLSSLGVASAMATAKPSGREGMRSPRWDVQKSTCAVRAATRSSSISTAGMKTVTSKSRGARASGSPWGCSLLSSLPLCGSVMTGVHNHNEGSTATVRPRAFQGRLIFLPTLPYLNQTTQHWYTGSSRKRAV